MGYLVANLASRGFDKPHAKPRRLKVGVQFYAAFSLEEYWVSNYTSGSLRNSVPRPSKPLIILAFQEYAQTTRPPDK